MRYYLDTEFIEHATGIQLVSIGIVREDGKTLYAESSTFDARLADQWVKDNVLAKLRLKTWGTYWDDQNKKITEFLGPEIYIKDVILEYIGEDKSPEFYAYYASYDWVVFARIFGRLIEKPEHFPMWVIDLKQMMWERGLTKEWKQKACPDPEGEHDALVDAQWNKKLYELIIKEKII
jgi:hypothetical protein